MFCLTIMLQNGVKLNNIIALLVFLVPKDLEAMDVAVLLLTFD